MTRKSLLYIILIIGLHVGLQGFCDPGSSINQKDNQVLEAVKALDDARLLQVVQQQSVSMCGYGPTAVVMRACQLLGSSEAQLVKYQTSGDVTGDMGHVVGYGGLVIP